MKAEFITAAISNPAIKTYYVADGTEQLVSGFVIKVELDFRTVKSLTLMDASSHLQRPIWQITSAHIDAFFNNFGADKGYTKSTYRQVKNSPHWKAAYGVTPCTFQKNDRVSGLTVVSEDGVDCRVCRVILPLRIITVDHQKAQDGGGTAAMLRVFRGFGLTAGAPTGRKNTAALAAYASQVGGNSAPMKGERPGRYSLNAAGAIYYSVLREAKQIDALETACMHHYLNLRPVCGPCNSSLRNLNIF
jgi:hypothetical protein